MATSLTDQLLPSPSHEVACDDDDDVAIRCCGAASLAVPGSPRSPGVTPRFGKQEILEGVETVAVPEHLQSDFQTVMNTVNLYVGAGLLSMPYAMKIGGWLGLAVLGLCAAVSCATGHFLAYACDALPPGLAPSYPALGRAAFGPAGEWLLLGSVMLEFWGALSLCLIIVWRCLAIVIAQPTVCLSALGGSWCLETKDAVVLLTLAVAVPVILIRTFSRLASVAMSGVFSSAVLCTMMVAAWSLDPSGSLLPQQEAHQHKVVDWPHLPMAAGIFIVSLSGHAGLPSLRRGMKSPSHLPSCLKATFLCIFLLYATMGVFGYLYFGEMTHVLITSNLDEEGSLAGLTLLSWGSFSLTLSQLLSLLVSMSVFTSVPPLTYVLGEILTDFTVGVSSSGAVNSDSGGAPDRPLSRVLLRVLPREGWEISFRVIVLGTGYAVALLCYKYLARMESLIGGVLSMSASLLLPTLIFYSLRWRSLSITSRVALRCFICLVLFIPVVVIHSNATQ